MIDRLTSIDAELPPDDGVAVFNRMYLEVTHRVGSLLAEPPTTGDGPFQNQEAMAELDVVFACLWLRAYDASVAGRPIPSAWRPLFEARKGGRLPIQYALAGMNSHIEHDLPVAVVRTCESRGLVPADVHADYEAVNLVLAGVEAGIRRSFLDEIGRRVDDEVGPVVHLVSSWHIDKARDLSWVTTETIWTLRRFDRLRDRFLSSLGHTVAMVSRTLLTPTC